MEISLTNRKPPIRACINLLPLRSPMSSSDLQRLATVLRSMPCFRVISLKIWGVANYVRDAIRPADYNKLILTFAALRRFECALEPTREAACEQVTKSTWEDDDPKYCALSGHCFYNVTSFKLSNLGATKT